jgi:hypothetical protein
MFHRKDLVAIGGQFQMIIMEMEVHFLRSTLINFRSELAEPATW